MTDTTNTNTTRAAALAMRDAAAALARRRPLYDGASGEPADEDLAQAIEDLPLPDADTTDWRAEAERLRGLLRREQQERHAVLDRLDAAILASTASQAQAEQYMAERNALAARLAEIAAQPPVAWIEHELQGTGLRHLHFERRPNTLRDEVVDPVWTELIARPAPAAAPELAAYLDGDIIEAQRAVVQQLASRPTCDWPGKCAHKRPALAAAPERAEPADPRTPPPGCRLLGDYEPAQAGDMAYIGAIGGRWRRVKPRMGIIGATMDELSDGGRVLALARPCRRGPEGCPDRVSRPRGAR